MTARINNIKYEIRGALPCNYCCYIICLFFAIGIGQQHLIENVLTHMQYYHLLNNFTLIERKNALV